MEPIAGNDQLEADVRSSTDEATHVVFDPAAIMHVMYRDDPGPMSRFTRCMLCGIGGLFLGFVLIGLLGFVSVWVPFWEEGLAALAMASGAFGIFMTGWALTPSERKRRREERAREARLEERMEKYGFQVLIVLRADGAS